MGVVIALGVDHQAFQHALELALDLFEQGFELTRLQKRRDVVIGVEALLGLLDTRPDPGGDGFLVGGRLQRAALLFWRRLHP